MFKNLMILLGLIIVLLLGGLYYSVTNKVEAPLNKVDDNYIACTADAMQCPDGTWVGRTGPDCEFVCP